MLCSTVVMFFNEVYCNGCVDVSRLRSYLSVSGKALTLCWQESNQMIKNAVVAELMTPLSFLLSPNGWFCFCRLLPETFELVLRGRGFPRVGGVVCSFVLNQQTIRKKYTYTHKPIK